jgi:phage-related protein
VRLRQPSIFAWISKDNPGAAANVVRRIRERINRLGVTGLAHIGRPGLLEGTRGLVEPPCRRALCRFRRGDWASGAATLAGPCGISQFCYVLANMRWTVETLNAAVDAEVEALPNDMRARLVRLSSIIEQVGLQGLPRDAVKHLEGRLWELRIAGRDGISRAIYVTAAVQRVVIVRVFMKKTQKTPPRELELARQRAKEVP